jgi:hypothetical protein
MNPNEQKTHIQRIRVRLFGQAVEDSFLIRSEAKPAQPPGSLEAGVPLGFSAKLQ